MSRTEERKGASVGIRVQLLEGDMDKQEARVSKLLVTAVGLLGSVAVGIGLALISALAR